MSIFPATDIIADVARAADPKRQQVAFSRLEAISKGAQTTFASVAGESSAKANEKSGSGWRLSPVGLRAAYQPAPTRPVSVAAGTDSVAEAAKKFESLVLQTFFEALLPKGEETYGAGASGSVWRSLMAEQLSNQFAASGAIGLKKMLETKMNASAPATVDTSTKSS